MGIAFFYNYIIFLLQLNDFELRKGKKLGVTISFNNHRLFVGNIPKNRDRDELLDEFDKHARKFCAVVAGCPLKVLTFTFQKLAY